MSRNVYRAARKEDTGDRAGGFGLGAVGLIVRRPLLIHVDLYQTRSLLSCKTSSTVPLDLVCEHVNEGSQDPRVR